MKRKKRLKGLKRINHTVNRQAEMTQDVLNGVRFQTATSRIGWLDETGFFPGEWAVDHRYLLMLFRILQDIGPSRILEFGMGETTKMLSAYTTRRNTDAKAFTVEHNAEWVEFFSRNNDNVVGVDLVKTELHQEEIKGCPVNYYTDLVNSLPSNEKFELLLVDGPIGSQQYSRYNLCETIEAEFLATDFVILVDDANRPGEQQTIKDAKQILVDMEIEFQSGYLSNSLGKIYAIYSPRYSFVGSI